MQIQVDVNKLNAITRDYLNENEYHVHKVYFEFSEEYTDDLVKVALFTQNGNTYKMIITNNQCNIPAEILAKKGTFILGVYAYTVENEELILRYSPSPIKLFISSGSYIPDSQTENSEPITPSELEQYQQALQDGLSEVNSKLDDIDEALTEVDNLNIDAEKVGDTTTVTITKKDGTQKEVEILDGKDGEDGYTPVKGEDYFTPAEIEQIEEDAASKVIVPTKLSDLYNDEGFIDNSVNNLINYELKINTGSRISLSINPSTYVMTFQLKNSANTVISSDTVDLPLESVVVNGSYDTETKKIILTLQNGNTIEFSVEDLVEGLQSEITINNKLDSGLVDDSNSDNKFVTSTEKTTWNSKYVKPSGGIPKTDLTSEVQASLGKADTALQEHQDISGKENISNKTNELTNESTTEQYPNAKVVYDSQVEQDELIETLEQENADLKERLADAENNQLTGTAEGTEIDITDSADSRVRSIELEGNSTQETVEGNQIFDKDYFLQHKSDFFNAYNGYFWAINVTNIFGDKYKKQITASISLKGQSMSGVALAFTTSYGTSPGGATRILTTDGTIKNVTYDFTNAENVYFQVGASVQGTALNNLDDIFANYEIMLNEGSTALPYEPYTGRNTITQPIISTRDI